MQKNMKKIKYIIAAAALMALPFTFTSCDDDPHERYWYDEPIGGGWSGSWNNMLGNNTKTDDTKLRMAATLAQQWRGELYAFYNDESGVQQVDTFDIDLDYKQVASDAAAGTCTEYSWPVVNGEVAGDDQRNINTYIWYIDNNYDINITYSNGDKCKIDYDDLRLGNYDGEGTIFDGTMETSYDNEYYKFWTNLYQASATAKGTRAASAKPYRIVVVKK